jgi:kumamolisin
MRPTRTGEPIMSPSPDQRAVHGSAPVAPADARILGPVPDDERLEVTVRIRHRIPLAGSAAGMAATGRLQDRHYLTREQYAADLGADQADIDKIAAFAHQAGLVVVGTSIARRSVFLSGTAKQFADAFVTSVERVELDTGIARRRTSPIHVPAELIDIVEGVFGIGDTPIAVPHFRTCANAIVAGSGTPGSSFTSADLATLYHFPPGLDGTGQCIGIIELGGGYRTSDIDHYFKGLNLPSPRVTTVSVDGAKNSPTTPFSADGEVMLDIEIAAAIAPKAQIAVYFAPNSDKGFLDAITMAIHDEVNRPSVISISWGAPEKDWTAQAMDSFDQAFQSAAVLGITICCASGDAGSGDENPDRSKPDGLAHVDFPGSSPAVLCCGGTRLTAANGTVTAETVWNNDPLRSAGGGGISDVFALPPYQASAGVPPSANAGGRIGRGVPDVAGDADPATGYRIRVDGVDTVFGGTSAVAPLWAGLIALMNQRIQKPVGFLNPLLYEPVVRSTAFRDITEGNIGAYAAKVGWDPCTGCGTPNGTTLLHALGG